MPIFQYRFGNGLQKARHLIASGLAGKPYLATVETAWTRDAAYYAVPWRGKFATELGGALLGHAIHAHDLLTYLMGPVAVRVRPHRDAGEPDRGRGHRRRQPGTRERRARLPVGDARLGARDQPTAAVLRACDVPELALSPYAPADDPWHIVPASAAAAEAIGQALAGWRFVCSRFAGLFAAMHAALASGGELPVTLADARRSLELVTALYHAAETRGTVALPLGPDHPRYGSWRPAASAVAAPDLLLQ